MNNFPGLFDYENRMEKLSQTRSGLRSAELPDGLGDVSWRFGRNREEGEQGTGRSPTAGCCAYVQGSGVATHLQSVRRAEGVEQGKKPGAARVEHIFGQMTNTMKAGLYLRYIGIKRIIAGVGLLNLAYNMIRYEQIRRLGLV